ncbi:uncharacterized protein EDB91DRAFT_317782 [Suillus paluster]|uniref:uncharacterized protein n=1 Tax=Suillus paluster TaxID=48578 RepID=UPI001B872D0D|nr:uncharacterized protein EDB91DRAFT_317782 [Suillus paluster]KAG1741860.1 hypothetical protein EDB91DRAFT_317782 [Suillus paluster]
MNKKLFQQTKRKIRTLLIRHLDVFVLYVNQPQARLEFLKREILLNPELSFLTQYEDGWAVDVLIRHEFRKRDKLEELAENTQFKQAIRQSRVAPVVCLDAKHNQADRVDVAPVVHLGARHTQADRVDREAATASSSRLALLPACLDSVTPSLLRFHRSIIQGGLCTDEHLNHFSSLSAASKDKFILQALGKEKSTVFERVVVAEILDQMKKEKW